MNGLKIHHIGIKVSDLEKSRTLYQKLGYVEISPSVDDLVQNNRIQFLVSADQAQTIELIQPLDRASSIFHFSDGYHHVCYDASSEPDFLNRFRHLHVGKIFTVPITAPAIGNKKVVFALLQNKALVEFLL